MKRNLLTRQMRGEGKKMKSRFLLALVLISIGMQLSVGEPAHAYPVWDLTGNYTIYGYGSGYSGYSAVTVTTENLQTGEFWGTALNIGWDPSWTFSLSGVTMGNTFTFDATCPDHDDWGTETGTINDDGSLSNIIWVDRYGNTAYGWSVAGNATPVSPVPIPGAVWLLGFGLAGFLGLKRKCQYVRDKA